MIVPPFVGCSSTEICDTSRQKASLGSVRDYLFFQVVAFALSRGYILNSNHGLNRDGMGWEIPIEGFYL